MNLNSVSIIIVCTESSQAAQSIGAARALLKTDSAARNHELWVVEGDSPSKQRNAAAAQARGEWLLFLDNDSIVDPMILEYYRLGLAEFPKAKVLGGASLLRPETESSVELAIQAVFSTDLGIGPLKARYYPTGKIRKSGEKELILCNMLVERSTFLSAGGFTEGMYPNEENEFLNRISSHSMAIYCPGAIVYRNHRKTIMALAQQMFRYGRGRLKHFRVSPHLNQWVFFLPLVFMIYVFALFIRPQAVGYWVPGAIYLVLTGFEGFIRSIYHRKLFLLPVAIACFFSCHFFYALGLAFGMLSADARSSQVPRVLPIQIT